MTGLDPLLVFDRALLRQRRERAARDWERHDFLKREIADRLVDRLTDVRRTFPLALDLGSHERWQTLGMAKEAAVAYYSRRGQDESAMQAGMELAAMAKRLQSIDAWPSYYNRGVDWHERACKAIAGLLRQTSLDARSLVVMQAEFERHSPSEAMLKERLTGFYEFDPSGASAGPTSTSAVRSIGSAES